MPRLGPYSRPQALQSLDGRSWQARLVKQTRQELINHLGGKPSYPQIALIDRVAWLTLHIAEIDKKVANGKPMTEHDSRTYLAWSNTLSKTVMKIGLKPAAMQAMDLKQHIANKAIAA